MEIRDNHREVMSTFMTNGVHGQVWSKTVYAVAHYSSGGATRYFTARNVNRLSHAENGVINHVEDLLTSRKLTSPKIKLYLSYSPCHECSQRIVNLLTTARWCHHIALEVEIVFSALYRIRRPSCEKNRSCHRHLPSYDDHIANVDGLKKLFRTPGVVLRTFTQRDWLQLWIALGFPSFDIVRFNSRSEEDELLEKDFEQTMGMIRTGTLTLQLLLFYLSVYLFSLSHCDF